MNKFLLSLAAVLSVGLGYSQIPKALDFGPNVVVPTSTQIHVGEKPGTMHTHYLKYVGPWKYPSLDDGRSPDLATHGPVLQSGISGYHPADIRAAYGMTKANLGQDAIAIVDAYSSGYAFQDFNIFARQFGLKTETSSNPNDLNNSVLSIVYADGTQPQIDSGWAGEMALDIEWAHAIAPNAKIYLVQATDSSFAALSRAVVFASKLPGVRQVSMSYSSIGEFTGEQSDDSTYTYPGVVYFGSTGDYPGNKGYPFMSPNVVAVGGTSIQIYNGVVAGVSAWISAGAGPSTIVPRPTYQDSLSSVIGKFRGTPDISAVADPNTGVAVYDSYSGGWIVVGGTSVACPVTAAITNARKQYPSASTPITVKHPSSTFDELNRQYGFPSLTPYIRDVILGSIPVYDPTTGKATGVVYKAVPGYDFATGLGEPVGLYPPQKSADFSPNKVQNPIGTPKSGGIAQLGLSDGLTYNILSTGLTGLGQVAGTEALFKIDWSSYLPLVYTTDTVVLNVSASGSFGSTGQVYLYNYKTNSFDYIGAFPMFYSNGSLSYTLDKSKYLDDKGNVRLLTRAIQPLRFGNGHFTFRLDQASLTATANQQ
jgi:kumamolisin